MERKKITLNEKNLRDFVTYSVARLLKEAMGKPIYDRHGEFDGYTSGKYGSDTFKLEFDPENSDDMNDAYQSVLQEPDFQGVNEEELANVWPVNVNVWYTIEREEGGDRGETYDSASVEHWEPDMSNVPDNLYNFVNEVISNFFEGGYFTENDILDYNTMNNGMFEEENTGTLTHFGKKEMDAAAEKYPNPYENMTWDEYCLAKELERKQEGDKPKDRFNNSDNKGITTHFGGDIPERSPEEKERDEHMFDDEHWVNKMNLSRDELSEIVNKAVKRIMEEMNPAGEAEQVVDKFPKKAAGTFTMNTRRGNTDKYKVYVEKTDNEELLTDIFVYDPMDNEWYPQAEYVVGIEEYTNGTWLPYWETFNGDVSIRALANCFGKVVKLWKKVGYLFDEDDEIPFRYSGDIKPVGKMF